MNPSQTENMYNERQNKYETHLYAAEIKWTLHFYCPLLYVIDVTCVFRFVHFLTGMTFPI